MLVVLALECMIKLLVIIGVGAFITFGLYDGFGDIFQRLEQSDQQIFGLGPETRRTSSLISFVCHRLLRRDHAAPPVPYCGS